MKISDQGGCMEARPDATRVVFEWCTSTVLANNAR